METNFVSFKRLGLDIRVPVEIKDEARYIITIPRRIPQDSFLSKGRYLMAVDKQEFIDDINFQIPKSLNGNIEEIAFESLYQIVVKHINTYGRILRADLDTYIGQNILLFNAILESKGKQALTNEEQVDRFEKFNYMAFGILPDYLKEIYRTES